MQGFDGVSLRKQYKGFRKILPRMPLWLEQGMFGLRHIRLGEVAYETA